MEDADRSYIYAVARRIMRDDAEAEDVTQEALLLAHRFRDAFRGEASHRSWLHRITTRVALSALRRRRSRNRRLDALADHILTSADVGATAEDLLARARTSAQLADALASLDEKYRSVVELRLRDDLGEREIAEALGLSLATVKIRAFRARKVLRQALGM